MRPGLGGVATTATVLLITLVGCSGDGEPQRAEASGRATSSTPASSAESSAVIERVTQPPVPADPAEFTPEYVQTTLVSLYQDYREALIALRASGVVDDTVRAAMANVYHPDVLEAQLRNLEDYYPGGKDIEETPGQVVVEVTRIHSASASCILAVTTFSADALTTLDAPQEDNFFIGLARNPTDPNGVRPWLLTVEYGTSDGEPLPEDVCA